MKQMLEAFYKPLLAKAIGENTCSGVTDAFILNPAADNCWNCFISLMNERIVIVWKFFRGGNALKTDCAGW